MSFATSPWPAWKEERDDPCHRRPPLRNRHFLRPGSGLIRAATGRVRRQTRQRVAGRTLTRQRVTDAVGWPKSTASAAAASGGWRCRWCWSFPRQAEGGGRPSSRAVRLLLRQRQGRRAANLPRNRRGQTFRRPPRHRSRDRHEPGLCEGRGEQILLCDTPEHLATQPRRDSRRKERRGRAVDRAMAAAATSCRAPSVSPPPGRCWSIALMPKGSTNRRRQPSLEAPDARAKLLDTGR